MFDVFASSGLTTSPTFNIVCAVFFSSSAFMGFGFFYANHLGCLKNTREFGKLSGDVDGLQVRLNKLSEDQESIKLLLKTILEQTELFAESFCEILGLSGGLVEQTTAIVRSLDIISMSGGDLDHKLIETSRKLSTVRNKLDECIED